MTSTWADKANKPDPWIATCVVIAALTCTAGTIAAYRVPPQQATAGQPSVLAEVGPPQPLWVDPQPGASLEPSFGCLVIAPVHHRQNAVLRVVELVEGRAVAVLGELPLKDEPPARLDYDVRCEAQHPGPTLLACRIYRGGVPVTQSEPLQVFVGD